MLNTKLTGKQKAFKQLRAVAKSVPEDLGKALQTNAEEVADLASGFAPKETGDYADSINAKQIEDTAGVPKWGVFADWIWRFIEHGTAAGRRGERAGVRSTDVKQNKTAGRIVRRTHPGTPARPHLFPAYRLMKRRLKGRVTRSINKAVKRAVNR